MFSTESIHDADEYLRRFLQSSDLKESNALLERLLTEFAQPHIRRIARHKLSFIGSSEHQDTDDLIAEVLSDLLRRLREMKLSNDFTPIKDFAAYTAGATYRAFNDYLRRKYPQRHRLKARLRYVLTTNPQFCLWEDRSGIWICGYRKWEGSAAVDMPDASDVSDRLIYSAAEKTLAEIFDLAQGPLEFDSAVGFIAEVKGLLETPEVPIRTLGSENDDTLNRLQQREWLCRLWTEISTLPLPQRKALLLNLRSADGDSALPLFPIAGVATVRQIAELLEIEALQFAEIWNRLPLDDLSIASSLGLARQQVINLRKSARERLSRRMRTHNKW